MNRLRLRPRSFSVACLLSVASVSNLLLSPALHAQQRPYLGFAYPAGGQQGTTFQVKIGGQALEGVNGVLVTGEGITATVLEYNRSLGAQEITLLNEELRQLKRGNTQVIGNVSSLLNCTTPGPTAANNSSSNAIPVEEAVRMLIAKIEKRTSETVNRPASVALAQIAYVQMAIAPDAKPGARELRLATTKGISNPLVFHVGQLPEFSRKPMVTASLQVLGKEELALRKRPASEVEDRITIPCTVNGQVASGEINRYRFAARKGQRLVLTTAARQLIPYIADAVPGWFQPVLVLYDADGKEVAYDDDFRFKPDPTIYYEVPRDGEYVFAIYDSIYRGREDFVYRITVGEIPFVTSIFPLGAQAGTPALIHLNGWNLETNELATGEDCAAPGLHYLLVQRAGLLSNPFAFAVDTLPDYTEREPNNTPAKAQEIRLPAIVNGRMNAPGDVDVFRFAGKANESVVAEIYARRLDSPLDSVLKITDAKGRLLAFNDDHEDLGAGVNTHDADSYLTCNLPADGIYYLQVADTAQNGGNEFGYRLRISNPMPDFDLRVVPSSVSMRGKGSAQVSVYVMRKDGFTGPIKLGLQPGIQGFAASPATISGTQTVARLNLRTDLLTTKEPLNLTVIGTAKVGDKDVTHPAVPAEDRMQAFLWRHLVPASELKVMVFDPNAQLAPKRVAPTPPKPEEKPKTEAASADASGGTPGKKPQFTRQQVASRLRQLKMLYEEGLLTDSFYLAKVAECEAAQ